MDNELEDKPIEWLPENGIANALSLIKEEGYSYTPLTYARLKQALEEIRLNQNENKL
jgi:hypothetical protein